jgi:phosphate transport system protein
MARQRFEQALIDLGNSTAILGEQAGTAVQQATQALLERNIVLAQSVVSEDAGINRMERKILDDAADLLALQAPVASDLRRILGISRIASNFERIGDHARDIARGIIRLNGAALVDAQNDLPTLVVRVNAMLREGLQCYVTANFDQARAVAVLDDEVDTIYGTLHRDILAQILEEPSVAARATQTLFVGQDLEVIGDHVAIIAETVVYIATGQTVELN